jgi:hypothetical protein
MDEAIMAQRISWRFMLKQSMHSYVRYKQWLKEKHDFMFKPSICHFQLANRHYFFSRFSHSTHNFLYKKTLENIKCCISILSLNYTSIHYASKDSNVEWALNMCNLIPSTSIPGPSSP